MILIAVETGIWLSAEDLVVNLIGECVLSARGREIWAWDQGRSRRLLLQEGCDGY